MLNKMREPVSGLTHLAGAVSAIIGLVALLLWSSDDHLLTKVSLIVYGVSLFLLFLASSVYHLVRATPRVTAILRKLDHSAIYLLIAGTYTPFCLTAFRGFWQWGLLAIVWSLAIVGICVKIWVIHPSRWVTAGVYVIMGWLCAFAIQEILAVLPLSAITWLVIGGLTYTAGAVVYITKRMNFLPGVFGFHEVWHLFVLLGAAAHFISIASLVIHGTN